MDIVKVLIFKMFNIRKTTDDNESLKMCHLKIIVNDNKAAKTRKRWVVSTKTRMFHICDEEGKFLQHPKTTEDNWTLFIAITHIYQVKIMSGVITKIRSSFFLDFFLAYIRKFRGIQIEKKTKMICSARVNNTIWKLRCIAIICKVQITTSVYVHI